MRHNRPPYAGLIDIIIKGNLAPFVFDEIFDYSIIFNESLEIRYIVPYD